MSNEFTIKTKDAPLGAVVGGLDLGRADEGVVEKLRAALAEHLVLVFHDQRMSDDQLLAVSRLFGEIDPPGANPTGKPFHATHPEINVISNITLDGKPTGNLGAGEAVWHADMTYLEVPPRAALLYALEVPEGQGATYFCDLYKAYEALPEGLKRDIEGKVAIHDASHNSAGMPRKGFAEVTDVRETPGARHPLVRQDPNSGRKALFLGRRPRSYVVGLPVSESDALLDRLWEHATQDRFAMRHDWTVGDALMWSNHDVLHRRDAFDPASRRRMHRTQIRRFWSDPAPEVKSATDAAVA